MGISEYAGEPVEIMSNTESPLQPGVRIGPEKRFELLKKLGKGGMGVVWLALDTVAEKARAIKIVNPSALDDFPAAERMLLREAEKAQELRHENIVEIYDVHMGKDEFFIVSMEYLPGLTLRDFLEEYADGHSLAPEKALAILFSLAVALQRAHGKGIVHRDIKPENVIMATKDGKITDNLEEITVKLIDFGLSYQIQQTTAMINRITKPAKEAPIRAGSWGYAAPEVWDGEKPDKKADIHSLACMAWEMLCGFKKLPFGIRRSEFRQPETLPERPDDMDRAVYRVLCWGFAYHPSQRPASVGAFYRALEKVLPVPPPFIHGWPTRDVQRLQQETAGRLGLPVAFRDRLRDGTDGPEMMVIPVGRFLMGSPEDEEGRDDDEGQHEVSIEQPFALASEALTFAWYDRFCETTGRKPPDDWGWGRADRPVLDVSWNDAVDFCAWLSEQTGQRYRLPTEAEWEYACRAGTTTAFWWGDGISTRQANYDGNYIYRDGAKGEYREKTVPVRSFKPNPWGLYQMHGNVWEWTASDWSKDYNGQELLPSQGNGDVRVVRGGGWSSKPARVRPAARSRNRARGADNGTGFRLARSL